MPSSNLWDATAVIANVYFRVTLDFSTEPSLNFRKFESYIYLLLTLFLTETQKYAHQVISIIFCIQLYHLGELHSGSG